MHPLDKCNGIENEHAVIVFVYTNDAINCNAWRVSSEGDREGGEAKSQCPKAHKHTYTQSLERFCLMESCKTSQWRIIGFTTSVVRATRRTENVRDINRTPRHTFIGFHSIQLTNTITDVNTMYFWIYLFIYYYKRIEHSQ